LYAAETSEDFSISGKIMSANGFIPNLIMDCRKRIALYVRRTGGYDASQ
jgi:hypothetical protein